MPTSSLFLRPLLMLCLISASGFAQSAEEVKSPCQPCEALLNHSIPDVRITSTEVVEESTSFCKVLGTISKEIQFELLLPQSWNGRYVMGGGGGFVGSIQNVARNTVNDGYATSGTNTGHEGSGIKADWAYHNMERQLNFGYLAVHRTAVVSKALIRAYYCASPEYSYFMGCSRGGGQALIEAQRYPDDFDGIVSAAPIIDWPATGVEFMQNTKALYPDPTKLETAPITQEHLQLLQEIVLEQCDAKDGLKDGILNDPRDCAFDVSALPVCRGNQAGKDCFTTRQIEIVKTIYEGPTINGERVYPGFPLGSEAEAGGMFAWIVGPNQGTMQLNFPSLHYAFGTEMFKYLVFQDPDWDYTTYDFSNWWEDTRYAASYLNATSTDYSAFKEKGGKLIIYHGWNDPALSAFTAIEHYEAAKQEDAELEDYMRLFLLPGVLHCGGGPGPDQADWLAHIRKWVEEDKAPEKVIVSKTDQGEVVMRRPVFPYPARAAYDGKGNPNVAESFVRKDQN